jgi:hypothetical protein
MRDADAMSKAILDIELILSKYLEPGPRDADRIISAIIERLDRGDIVAVAERVQTARSSHYKFRTSPLKPAGVSGLRRVN